MRAEEVARRQITSELSQAFHFFSIGLYHPPPLMRADLLYTILTPKIFNTARVYFSTERVLLFSFVPSAPRARSLHKREEERDECVTLSHHVAAIQYVAPSIPSCWIGSPFLAKEEASHQLKGGTKKNFKKRKKRVSHHPHKFHVFLCKGKGSHRNPLFKKKKKEEVWTRVVRSNGARGA